MRYGRQMGRTVWCFWLDEREAHRISSPTYQRLMDGEDALPAISWDHHARRPPRRRTSGSLTDEMQGVNPILMEMSHYPALAHGRGACGFWDRRRPAVRSLVPCRLRVGWGDTAQANRSRTKTCE